MAVFAVKKPPAGLLSPQRAPFFFPRNRASPEQFTPGAFFCWGWGAFFSPNAAARSPPRTGPLPAVVGLVFKNFCPGEVYERLAFLFFLLLGFRPPGFFPSFGPFGPRIDLFFFWGFCFPTGPRSGWVTRWLLNFFLDAPFFSRSYPLSTNRQKRL